MGFRESPRCCWREGLAESVAVACGESVCVGGGSVEFAVGGR